MLLCGVALSAWAVSPTHTGALPTGRWTADSTPSRNLVGDDADRRRLDALRRAAVRVPSPHATAPSSDLPGESPLTCRFAPGALSGTTPKFHCVLDGGELVKVKYGRNAEIHAETAATRLAALLGFPSDTVTIVPRLRCYGCPRLPFESRIVASWFGADSLFSPAPGTDGYTDFDWVAIERRFPAAAIETAQMQGWGWREMKYSQAPGADLDALRLFAVFLAHWDNKTPNQRLACLDRNSDASQPCAEPLLIVDDLGATFGPYKVNLASWRDAPIWADARRCVVGMRALPYGGGTFPDVRISEAGRQQFLERVAAIGDAELRDLFSAARFPEFYSGTDDRRDLDAWVAAFHERVRRVTAAGPCA